jgi:hypothetical protein
MFEGKFFIFEYSSDISYGGNPPWIMQVENGTLVDKLNPYDYDEDGEFHNTRKIILAAIKYLQKQGVSRAYTFSGQKNTRYFGKVLNRYVEDLELGPDIDCFSAFSDTSFDKAGIQVIRVNPSELEQITSNA